MTMVSMGRPRAWARRPPGATGGALPPPARRLLAGMTPPKPVRAQFPSLAEGFAFFDNAGGSQVPAVVIDAISDYFRTRYAQTGGTYPASLAAKQTIDGAHAFISEF